MGYRLKVNPNGNVSKDVFLKEMKELKYMFPTWKMDLSEKDVMSLLYKFLGYTKDKNFIRGIDNYIKKETMNPTVSSLRKYIKSIDNRYPNIAEIDTFKGIKKAYVFGDFSILIEENIVWRGLETKQTSEYCSDIIGDKLSDISSVIDMLEIVDKVVPNGRILLSSQRSV